MNSIPQFKTCNKCKIEKPLTEFYPRSGYTTPEKPATIPGHYLTECKACMAERGRTQVRAPKTVSGVATEIIAIEMLKRVGIPTLPGKAVAASDVDAVCYGAIWLEIKYARMVREKNGDSFTFVTTPKQQKRGFLADFVMLICEYPSGERTAHLFPSKHQVFYMKGRLKSGLVYTVGQERARKHGNNRVVMTQTMMDKAKDAYWLIKRRLFEIEQELKRGDVLPFELNTSRPVNKKKAA